MKILFLPVYHYPEKAASLYLGENAREEYARLGWKMKMYCPYPTRGVSEEERKKYILNPNTEELGGALSVERFKLPREGKNLILRAIRYFVCQQKHYRLAKKEKDTDVLFVSSTPPIQGLLMGRLKKKLGCKTVYNLQDIFPDSLVNANLTQRGSFVWRIGRLVEDKTYKSADKIIVISEKFKQNIMAKGVPENKIEIVRNWVDESAVVPVSRENNPIFDRYKLDKSHFYVTYCGNIGKSQNLQLLVEVAEKLRENKDIRFVVIGDGVCKGALEQMIAVKELDNIKLIPFLPYEEISYVFSLGDAGLVISKPGIGTNSVPSKTWSIMCAERAVISSFDIDSELGDVITESECGICVPPDNVDGLVEAILRLKNNPEECRRYGENGRKYTLANLTKEIGCKKLSNLIDDLVNNAADN